MNTAVKHMIVVFASLGLSACASRASRLGYPSYLAQHIQLPQPGTTSHAAKTHFHPANKKASPTHQRARQPVAQGPSAVQHANLSATQQPNSEDYIDSIMTFGYKPGALYHIYCAPLRITDIAFKPGETVTSIAAGDTYRWQVSKTRSGPKDNEQAHLLLKPNITGLNNNIVVTTSERTYHLTLTSTPSTYMAVVQWSYPDDKVLNTTSTNADFNPLKQVDFHHVDFNYRITLIQGNPPYWMPKSMFTDTHKTYLAFPPGRQQSPLLFVGDSPDTDHIVNYRVVGNYYIIDRVVQSIQLRLGNSIVQINHVPSRSNVG